MTLGTTGIDSTGWGSPADSYRRPRPIIDDWSWQAQGECLRWPTEIFYPEDLGRTGLRARERRAKQICRDCPVLTQCREHALGTPEVHGIWGATTARERAQVIAGER